MVLISLSQPSPSTDSIEIRSYTGAGALGFLQRVLPASLASLPVPKVDGESFGSTLSVLLNEEGGIIDDCMVTRWGQDSLVHLFCVISRVVLTRSLWRQILSRDECGSS